MKNKSIEVYVEKAVDGTYWGTTQNLPGVVTAFGNSLEELKINLQEAYSDYLEMAIEVNEEWIQEVLHANVFVYRLDIQALFKLIPEIKISSLAKKAGINESLMRQYATGKANASEERAKKIEKALHELGNELLSVTF
ncbi:type II toxin-antitoxin system HicB family antitoxin [Gillisia hiemivivida]|uniref:Type II toxin-antitoxin system HicB family antitoxin n=1 Tax=Gillisia hiemivivida TaxID=291190 RepID=A0A5C6ZT35_9FLAO|nr:type II toxin-antitoxin system HicB family antitoxin [Gillisia hiemivivida]TXD93875.1 type II toxin-antitoxin system HicB family antitoxin [Gillisia hiemivivida]